MLNLQSAIEQWEQDPPQYLELGCGPFAEMCKKWFRNWKKWFYGIDIDLNQKADWARNSLDTIKKRKNIKTKIMKVNINLL